MHFIKRRDCKLSVVMAVSMSTALAKNFFLFTLDFAAEVYQLQLNNFKFAVG